eukprot:777389_1
MAYTAKMLLVLGVLVGATFAETVPDPHCCRSYRDLSTIEDPRDNVGGGDFTEIIEKLHTNFHTAAQIKPAPHRCDQKEQACANRLKNLFQLSPTVGACGDPFLVGASRVCVPLCCSCCQDLKVLKINDLTLPFSELELVSAPASGLSLCHDFEMEENEVTVDIQDGSTRVHVEVADDQVELVSGATSGSIRPLYYRGSGRGDRHLFPLRLYCEDRCGASDEEPGV